MWAAIGALGAIATAVFAGLALRSTLKHQRLERIARVPDPEIRLDRDNHIKISIPENGEFLIESVSLGRTPGSLQSSQHVGYDDNTDESRFEDSGRIGRVVNVNPPSTSVWLKIETSAPRSNLDIKIISDRFSSETISKVLYTK